MCKSDVLSFILLWIPRSKILVSYFFLMKRIKNFLPDVVILLNYFDSLGNKNKQNISNTFSFKKIQNNCWSNTVFRKLKWNSLRWGKISLCFPSETKTQILSAGKTSRAKAYLCTKRCSGLPSGSHFPYLLSGTRAGRAGKTLRGLPWGSCA